MNETDPILYELHYTLKAESPEDAAAKAGAVVGMIEKEHGIVASQAQPSLKPLAYPIKKEREAYVGWVRFMMKPEALLEFEKNLRASASLLRFMAMRAHTDDMSVERRGRKRITAPTAPAPEAQAKNEEIDKKLEEILGA